MISDLHGLINFRIISNYGKIQLKKGMMLIINAKSKMFISWQSYGGLQITAFSLKEVCKFFVATRCSMLAEDVITQLFLNLAMMKIPQNHSFLQV